MNPALSPDRKTPRRKCGVRVLILAAGYAVRLQPLTLNTPKPLLKIGGATILDRMLDKLEPLKDRVEAVHIITNEKFFEKFLVWFKEAKRPFEIILMNDGTGSNETRLGAIKDLDMAIKDGNIDSDLLVIAGDNLFEFDLEDFLDFSKTKIGKVCVALHDIKDFASAKRFGVACIDKDCRVAEFEEKPERPKSTLISTGVYYIPKEKLGLIGEYVTSGEKTDAPGYYIKWLSDRKEVYGFTFDEDWYDIGDIRSYEEADRKYGSKN